MAKGEFHISLLILMTNPEPFAAQSRALFRQRFTTKERPWMRCILDQVNRGIDQSPGDP